MFDPIFWFILVWLGPSAVLIVFLAVTPSQAEWIVEARRAVLFGDEERGKRLLHWLKGKFRKRRGKRK